MIERKTLLDILERKQTTIATPTSLHMNVLPVLSENSEEVVSGFLEGLETASDSLMGPLSERIRLFMAQDLLDLTGQDIVVELLAIESAMEDIDRVVSQIKVEATLTKMSYDDEYNREYQQLLDGTVNDRNAYAEGKTTKLRYLAYAKQALADTLERRQNSLRKQVSYVDKLLWQGIRDNRS